MSSEHVTIMIKGSVNDMFGEFCYFIKEIFPEVKKLCNLHNIDIDYVDSFYSISDDDLSNNRLILSNLNAIDSDRTFFICFRGQRLGWVPNENDVDKLTLDTYPELVNYIGTISISELLMLHALKPFDKYESGELVKLPPVSHALFYFRNPNYVEKLDDYQKLFYTNSIMGENAEVPDMNIARAKDLIYELKRELDSKEDSKTQINIRYYEGIWKDGLRRYDIISQYIREYSKLHDIPYDELMKEYGYLFDEEAVGCFADFKCENKSLKECIVEDIMNALKMEFPQNFN